MTKYEFMIYRVTNVSEIEHGKISRRQSPISGVNSWNKITLLFHSKQFDVYVRNKHRDIGNTVWLNNAISLPRVAWKTETTVLKVSQAKDGKLPYYDENKASLIFPKQETPREDQLTSNDLKRRQERDSWKEM